MRNYFDSSDDFFYIINSIEPFVQNISLISTGWTNFVFVVKGPKGEKIFRFPRNDFFAGAIKKECEFVQSINKRDLSFSIPNLQLCYHKNRPFSCHEKLAGEPLKTCRLSLQELGNVAEDVCKFLKEFGALKHHIPLPTCSQFLDELSLVPGGYDLDRHLPLKRLEKEKLVLSHGDFNTGNILISNGRVSGIIDFAFVSLSHPLNDLARLVGRADEEFGKAMTKAYQKSFGAFNEREERDLIDMWGYVDQKYISYIKTHHPEIELKEN